MRTRADILVLDEPTAAMDAQAEAEVFEHFRQLARERITILISHRFSTVRMADQIAVLDRGRIVEHGSHEELMKLRRPLRAPVHAAGARATARVRGQRLLRAPYVPVAPQPAPLMLLASRATGKCASTSATRNEVRLPTSPCGTRLPSRTLVMRAGAPICLGNSTAVSPQTVSPTGARCPFTEQAQKQTPDHRDGQHPVQPSRECADVCGLLARRAQTAHSHRHERVLACSRRNCNAFQVTNSLAAPILRRLRERIEPAMPTGPCGSIARFRPAGAVVRVVHRAAVVRIHQ